MTAAVEVNEARIFATGHGAGWWSAYRAHFEPAGRITIITPSVGGDRVLVDCDSPGDARQLIRTMTANGVPEAAVRVRRRESVRPETPAAALEPAAMAIAREDTTT